MLPTIATQDQIKVSHRRVYFFVVVVAIVVVVESTSRDVAID